MQMMTRREWLAAQEYNARSPRREFTPEEEGAIARLFPNVDPGVRPFGQRVLVQLRLSRLQSAGGIELVAETRDTQQWNEAVAQVIAVGPLAFKKRDTLQAWGEGVWAEVGDYVRVPRFGGDRWEVHTPNLDAQQRALIAERGLELRIEELQQTKGRTPRQDRDLDQLQSELRRAQAQPEATIPVIFAQFNDHELIGLVTGNPVDMKVYV